MAHSSVTVQVTDLEVSLARVTLTWKSWISWVECIEDGCAYLLAAVILEARRYLGRRETANIVGIRAEPATSAIDVVLADGMSVGARLAGMNTDLVSVHGSTNDLVRSRIPPAPEIRWRYGWNPTVVPTSGSPPYARWIPSSRRWTRSYWPCPVTHHFLDIRIFAHNNTAA